MKINDIELSTLAIDSLKEMENVLCDLILQHYDNFEVSGFENKLYDGAIKRDMFKLSQVKAEINRRFQTELLTVLDNDGLKSSLSFEENFRKTF